MDIVDRVTRLELVKQTNFTSTCAFILSPWSFPRPHTEDLRLFLTIHFPHLTLSHTPYLPAVTPFYQTSSGHTPFNKLLLSNRCFKPFTNFLPPTFHFFLSVLFLSLLLHFLFFRNYSVNLASFLACSG